MKPRICLRLEFDGTNFCGWQLQHENLDGVGDHLPSIQGELERAVGTVLRRDLSDRSQRIVVQGCGRTDAGVHAEEFFCHFDLESDEMNRHAPDLEKFRHSLNCVLPDTIVITRCELRHETFHALKSVAGKTYEYQVLLRRAKPTLARARVEWLPVDPALIPNAFDVGGVREAMGHIEGQHDFKAFMSAQAKVKSSVRTITRAELKTEWVGDDPTSGLLLRYQLSGVGFLKQMVRNLVGTFNEVGLGKRRASSLLQLLGSGDGTRAPASRQEAGYCAPALGLTLKRVVFDVGAHAVLDDDEE